MRISIRRVCLCALCAALIAVGAFIRVPVPPWGIITLQLFFVLLAGVILGPGAGALSALCYVALGLAGAPIFAGGGGISYVAQPTFGFIYGFVPAALVAGHVSRIIARRFPRRAVWAAIAGCTAALPPLYACGAAHGALVMAFVLHRDINLWDIVWGWCLIYMPLDLVKAIAAGYLGALVVRRLPGAWRGSQA